MTNIFDIYEHPLVAFWVKELFKNDPLALCVLTQSNLDLFSKMWEKPTDAKIGGYTVWKRDHLGITVFAYVNEEITFYKVQYLGEKDMFVNDKRMGTYLTSFLTKLQKEIFNH